MKLNEEQLSAVLSAHEGGTQGKRYAVVLTGDDTVEWMHVDRLEDAP
jgi:hypothetical protein